MNPDDDRRGPHGCDDPRNCLECVLVATFTVRPEPLRRCLAALDEVSALIDALPQPVKDALAIPQPPHDPQDESTSR